jgi:hypothetical protein
MIGMMSTIVAIKHVLADPMPAQAAGKGMQANPVSTEVHTAACSPAALMEWGWPCMRGAHCNKHMHERCTL